MALAARVRDEQVGTPVTVEVRSRDTHPRIRVGHARDGCALLEAEAEPRRIGLPPAGPGDVLVQPVRVTVVGDVEIEPPIAVEIGEDCTEAVIEPRGLEACLNADLAKLRMSIAVAPDVEVQEITDAGDVVRKPRSGAGNGNVGVGRHAGLAAYRQVRLRRTAHVREPALRVPEQRGSRESTVLPPVAGVCLRVRVHDEQIDPAVVVVVESTQPTSGHRRRVGRDTEAKRTLTEVEPDPTGDVLETKPGE